MYCMYVLYNVLCVFLSCFFRSWINDKVVWSSFVGLFQQLFFLSCFVETPTLLSHPLANSADLQIYRDVAWFFYDQQIWISQLPTNSNLTQSMIPIITLLWRKQIGITKKIRNSNLLVIKHVLQTKLLRGKLCQIDKIVFLIFSVSEKYSAANFDGIGMQSFEKYRNFYEFFTNGVFISLFQKFKNLKWFTLKLVKSYIFNRTYHFRVVFIFYEFFASILLKI